MAHERSNGVRGLGLNTYKCYGIVINQKLLIKTGDYIQFHAGDFV